MRLFLEGGEFLLLHRSPWNSNGLCVRFSSHFQILKTLESEQRLTEEGVHTASELEVVPFHKENEAE